MLKLTLRRFAATGLAAACGLSGSAAVAQLTPLPALPRSDTPRYNASEPEADSRAGGALNPDADPIEGAEIVDGADIRAAQEEATTGPATSAEAGTVFAGMVTGVADGRLAVKMTPPRVSTAIEQVFKISNETAIIANGRTTTLTSVREGDFIRITVAPGDPELATRIVVATPPRANRRAAAAGSGPPRSQPALAVEGPPLDEDQDPNFDTFPDDESAPIPLPGPRKQAGDIDRRVVPQSDEEAVLPLGIEVFSHDHGALVTEMLAGGPAAGAGVLIGDLITEVNQQPIGDPEMIEELLSATATTGSAELTVLRDGQVLQLAVQPARIVAGSLTTFAAVQDALAVHGRVGEPGAARLVLPFGATRFTDYDAGGVVIDGRRDALLGGLLPNDVIIGLNGQPVTDRAGFLRSLDGLPANAETFGLSVMRNGERIDLDLPASAMRRSAAAPTSPRANVIDRGRGSTDARPGATGAGSVRGAGGTDARGTNARGTNARARQQEAAREADVAPATGTHRGESAPSGTGTHRGESATGGTGTHPGEAATGTQPPTNRQPQSGTGQTGPQPGAGQGGTGQTGSGQTGGGQGGGATAPPQ